MKKQKQNCYKVITKHNKGNYLPISNEIVWRYEQIDGERVYIPGEVLGMYMRLIFSTEEFHFNLKSLSKLMGYSMEKTRKCVNTLIELGYLRRYQQISKGRFTDSIYVIVESVDGEIDWEHTTLPNTIELQEESSYEFPDNEKPSSGKPECGKPECGKQNFGNSEGNNNNNINNKNIENNKNKNISQTFSQEEKVCQSFAGIKINKEDIKMDTCSMSEGQITSSILSIPKNEHEDAVQKRRGKKGTKNKVQQMEIEKGDSVSTMETQGYRNMINDLSAVDNHISRMIKQSNEVKEANKALNASTIKSTTNKKNLKKYAAKIINDKDILTMMEDYLDVCITRFGAMEKVAVKIMWEDLQKGSGGDKTIMLESIRNAIKNGYRQIYISKTTPNTYTPKQNSDIKEMPDVGEVVDESMYELATDEDGKPLTF